MQIEVLGIKISVQKKNIKNLNLVVSPPDGAVRISAPLRASDESIVRFAMSKYEWIRKKQEKIQGKPAPIERKLISGEPVFVFSREYLLCVEYCKRGSSFVISADKAILTVKEGSPLEKREAALNEWYRNALREQIEIYIDKWKKITGLYCSSWQIKNMSTRWGTCNTKTRKVWLNLQLAKKPIECLEYVILHELVHLKVPNHGKDFVALMSLYMPDWMERKKLLNEL